MLAHLEAYIDFPEDDIDENDIKNLYEKINEIINTNLFNKVSNSAKTEAIGLFSKSEKKFGITKVLVTLSVVAGMVDCFLF